MAKKADTIIYGNIYTVDRKQPGAAAAAIADGKFIYVGSFFKPSGFGSK